MFLNSVSFHTLLIIKFRKNYRKDFISDYSYTIHYPLCVSYVLRNDNIIFLSYNFVLSTRSACKVLQIYSLILKWNYES